MSVFRIVTSAISEFCFAMRRFGELVTSVISNFGCSIDPASYLQIGVRMVFLLWL